MAKFKPGDVVYLVDKTEYFTKFAYTGVRIIKNDPWYYWEYWNEETKEWDNSNRYNSAIDIFEMCFILATPAAKVLYAKK